ncbi:MAG TPA: response regulator [Kofleriaceae bacterium]|nr:response regulator [Kofleriaceae bacterium]
MRVLVLDDDPLTAFTLERLFAARGLEVVAVPTTEAAERAIETDRFDALLVDAQADQGKGVRLFPRARRLEGPMSLFLVSDRRAPRPVGEDADIYYIEKPWDGFFVVDIVRARCAGERIIAGASGRLRMQDERPTVDLRPMRRVRRASGEAPAR